MAVPQTETLEGLITGLKEQVFTLEESIKNKFSKLTADVNTAIDSLDTSLKGQFAQKMSESLHTIQGWTDDINEAVNFLSTKVSNLYDLVNNDLAGDIQAIKQGIDEWINKFKTLWESLDRQFQNVQTAIDISIDTINKNTTSEFDAQRAWIEKNVITEINKGDAEINAQLTALHTDIDTLNIKTQTYIEDAQIAIQAQIKSSTTQTLDELNAMSVALTKNITDIKDTFSAMGEDIIKEMSFIWTDAKVFFTDLFSFSPDSIKNGMAAFSELMQKAQSGG